jgi:hypothetical protein
VVSHVSASADLGIAAVGTTSIGYVSHPALSELAPGAFAAYLREEHLDQAAALLQRSSAQPRAASAAVREHFSRSLKALVGDGRSALVDCPLGLPLELSLARSPAGVIAVRATFEGQLQPGLWVELTDARGKVLEARATDANGAARFAAPRDAVVLRATHLQPSSRDDVAWRSWWASTTFAPTAAGVASCHGTDAATALPGSR